MWVQMPGGEALFCVFQLSPGSGKQGRRLGGRMREEGGGGGSESSKCGIIFWTWGRRDETREVDYNRGRHEGPT